MAEPFLALITPLGAPTAPQPPLGIWGGGNVPFPTPPMAPGGGGYWGQANDPGWSAGSPRPPYPSQGPGFPTPPIAGPGRPPGWGIAQDPGYGLDAGLGTWGGAGQPFPTPPIVIPPDLPPTLPAPDNRPIEWKTAWTPTTGWIVIGVPQGPAPTPS